MQMADDTSDREFISRQVNFQRRALTWWVIFKDPSGRHRRTKIIEQRRVLAFTLYVFHVQAAPCPLSPPSTARTTTLCWRWGKVFMEGSSSADLCLQRSLLGCQGEKRNSNPCGTIIWTHTIKFVAKLQLSSPPNVENLPQYPSLSPNGAWQGVPRYC